MTSDIVLKGFLSTQKPDWKTTSGVAHPFIDRISTRHLPTSRVIQSSRNGYVPLVKFPNKWKESKESETIVRKEEQSTTTGSTYQPKYTYTYEDIQRCAPSCERVTYARDYLHQPAKGFPPNPLKALNSVYQQEYTEKVADVSKPFATDTNRSSYCWKQLEGAGEPRLNIAEAGPFAQLDVYATTCLLTHRPFTRYEMKSKLFEKPIGSFHDTYEVSKSPSERKILPDIPVRRNPVYDELVFRSKASIRVLPKKTHAVPNRGLLTETQEQYQLP